jgi:hypothetical protein
MRFQATTGLISNYLGLIKLSAMETGLMLMFIFGSVLGFIVGRKFGKNEK